MISKSKNKTEVCKKMSDYKGKILLIVNTATGCGFTPQYQELQELYERYQKDGFEILDFPCNQFGQQAPGDAAEINSFCSLNYGTTFPDLLRLMSTALILLHSLTGSKKKRAVFWVKRSNGISQSFWSAEMAKLSNASLHKHLPKRLKSSFKSYYKR